MALTGGTRVAVGEIPFQSLLKRLIKFQTGGAAQQNDSLADGYLTGKRSQTAEPRSAFGSTTATSSQSGKVVKASQ